MKILSQFLALGAFAALLANQSAFAQSADALVEKLVQKGILTTKEAGELREEAAKGGGVRSDRINNHMPDWVNSLTFSGDLRLRFDGIYVDDPTFSDRNRFRYRLRFGAVAALADNFEIGLRLMSGENAKGGFTSLDPLSGNATFQDNASKKLIGIDQVFARWGAINSPDLRLNFFAGKIENPFSFSGMVFDPDYTPEGIAETFSYTLNDRNEFMLISGAFILDELKNSSRDPYLFAAQARWNAKWTPVLQSSFGVAFLAISSADGLNTANVPDQNQGNTRDAKGNLLRAYNPIVVNGAIVYSVEGLSFYPGTFPIQLDAEYVNNFGAATRNTAYTIGLTFGKSGKKGTWELSYRWKYLEGDEWYEELVDSDTGAFYKAAPVGGSAGYNSGTNLRGHYIRAAYSPFNSLTLAASAALFEAIDAVPRNSNSEALRVLVDAMWRF